jgi:hypothetical protein
MINLPEERPMVGGIRADEIDLPWALISLSCSEDEEDLLMVVCPLIAIHDLRMAIATSDSQLLKEVLRGLLEASIHLSAFLLLVERVVTYVLMVGDITRCAAGFCASTTLLSIADNVVYRAELAEVEGAETKTT